MSQKHKYEIVEGAQKETNHLDVENGSKRSPIPIMLKTTTGDVDQVLHEGQLDQCLLWAYERDRLRTVLIWCAYLVTVFVLRLMFHWQPH
jgi:hypothetical protein